MYGHASEETVNGRIRVFRRFFNYLEEEGFWKKANPAARFKLVKQEKDIKPIVRACDVERLLEPFNNRPFEGSRNCCITLLLRDAMVLQKELANVKLADVDLRGWLIKVLGKGNKERYAPIGPRAIKALHFYLNRGHNDICREFQFCSRAGEQLTDRHFYRIIRRHGKKIGLDLHAHLARASAPSWFIRQGGSPAILSKILGHTTLSITSKYVHMQSQDLVDAYQRCRRRQRSRSDD